MSRNRVKLLQWLVWAQGNGLSKAVLSRGEVCVGTAMVRDGLTTWQLPLAPWHFKRLHITPAGIQAFQDAKLAVAV